MKIEIIFHTSSTSKIVKKVHAVYTKGQFCCVQMKNNLIVKYPLLNIFSVAHKHGNHLGTTCKNKRRKK
jgi:hypothetical protein